MIFTISVKMIKNTKIFSVMDPNILMFIVIKWPTPTPIQTLYSLKTVQDHLYNYIVLSKMLW